MTTIDWRASARCRDADPGLFFSEDPALVDAAKRICASCAVREECREFGRTERFGVWGGVWRSQSEGSARNGRGEPVVRECGCGCGETFVTTARSGRRYVDNRHQMRRRRAG